MPIILKRTPLQSSYDINDIIIESISDISDLVVIFDRKLKFQPHIANYLAKSYKMLIFVMRLSKEFTLVSPNALTYFKTFWRDLELGICRHQVSYTKRLERLQRNYIRLHILAH